MTARQFRTVVLLVTLFTLGWALFAALHVAPTFEKLFADFGGQPPLLTRLCLQPWFLLVLGVLPLAMLALDALIKATDRQRPRLFYVTVLLIFAPIALFLGAMYLPIFSIADQIK